jgi:hypothetical protein
MRLSGQDKDRGKIMTVGDMVKRLQSYHPDLTIDFRVDIDIDARTYLEIKSVEVSGSGGVTWELEPAQ